MKKLIITLIFSILSVFIYAQTYTPDGKNWNHTGLNKFTKPVTIETKNLTGVKIDGYDATKAKVDNAAPAGNTLILKADSNYQKPGSYTTRYDFKNEPVRTPFQKALKGFGSTLKLFPLYDYAFPNNNAMIDNRIYFVLCYTSDTVKITGFKYSLTTQGSFTADNYNGIGLYSVSGGSGGTATLVSSTTNDVNGDLWKATASTLVTKDLPSPVTIAPGYYYIACVYNSSAQTTAPSIQGTLIPIVYNLGQGWPNNSGTGLSSFVAGNTLPTPFALSGFNNINVALPLIIAY